MSTPESDQAVRNYSNNEIVAGAVGRSIIEALETVSERSEDAAKKRLAEVATAYQEAAHAAGQAAFQFHSEIEQLRLLSGAALTEVRQHRCSLITETAQAAKALREVRTFFIGPDYEREQKRLAEFVDLCERLKVLKDSGFLDAITDIMLRLSI